MFSACMGDIVTLIENLEFEWVAAVNNRTGETGFIPLSILSPFVSFAALFFFI